VEITLETGVKMQNYTLNEWGSCKTTLKTSGEDVLGFDSIFKENRKHDGRRIFQIHF